MKKFFNGGQLLPYNRPAGRCFRIFAPSFDLEGGVKLGSLEGIFGVQAPLQKGKSDNQGAARPTGA
jgi:hypothetical protein